MFARLTDFDPSFAALDELRRRMDRAFDDVPFGPRLFAPLSIQRSSAYPRADLFDQGKSLALVADVPGLSEADLKVSLNQDVLTIAGERKAEGPEGYSVHRKERSSVTFSRSFTLPSRVNPDGARAEVKNGVLTITLEKTPDVQPRQITVRAK